MSYLEEYNKLLAKFGGSKNKMLVSNEYKMAYPRLSKLYKMEGLDIKRKNLLRNRRKLKQIGMEAMFAVK